MLNSGQQAYAADFGAAQEPTEIENNTKPNKLSNASEYYGMLINCNHHYLQRDQNSSSKQRQRGDSVLLLCNI